MNAFILAAGCGERLRPLTNLAPKPLVPVMNVPAIAYALALVREAGISRIAVNAHWHHRAMAAFFHEHDNFGFTLHLSLEDVLRGTGGGLLGCRSFLDENPFVILNGDMLQGLDLSAVIAAHQDSGRAGLLVVRPSVGAGRVTVSDGVVVDLRGLAGNPLPARFDYLGVAVMNPDIFRFLESGPSDIVVHGFMDLVARGELAAWEYDGPAHDIGTLDSYREANISLLHDDVLRRRVADATGLLPCARADDAIVGAGARIECSVVGARCRVGDGALVRDSVLLPGVTVSPNERIERQVLWTPDSFSLRA